LQAPVVCQKEENENQQALLISNTAYLQTPHSNRLNLAGKLNIAIVTSLGFLLHGKQLEEFAELSRLSIENKLLYSHLHMYPFYFYHSHLMNTSRPIHWGKFSALMHYLPFYDWLFWIDIDAFSNTFTI
jgi:hypothetical protein